MGQEVAEESRSESQVHQNVLKEADSADVGKSHFKISVKDM